jgi:hypothetical protein
MPGSIIETLGDLIDNHHRVGAWCPGGHGFRPIDMDVLIARLGRDWRYGGRRWPVCCAVCGAIGGNVAPANLMWFDIRVIERAIRFTSAAASGINEAKRPQRLDRSVCVAFARWSSPSP